MKVTSLILHRGNRERRSKNSCQANKAIHNGGEGPAPEADDHLDPARKLTIISIPFVFVAIPSSVVIIVGPRARQGSSPAPSGQNHSVSMLSTTTGGQVILSCRLPRCLLGQLGVLALHRCLELQSGGRRWMKFLWVASCNEVNASSSVTNLDPQGRASSLVRRGT